MKKIINKKVLIEFCCNKNLHRPFKYFFSILSKPLQHGVLSNSYFLFFAKYETGLFVCLLRTQLFFFISMCLLNFFCKGIVYCFLEKIMFNFSNFIFDA